MIWNISYCSFPCNIEAHICSIRIFEEYRPPSGVVIIFFRIFFSYGMYNNSFLLTISIARTTNPMTSLFISFFLLFFNSDFLFMISVPEKPPSIVLRLDIALLVFYICNHRSPIWSAILDLRIFKFWHHICDNDPKIPRVTSYELQKFMPHRTPPYWIWEFSDLWSATPKNPEQQNW